MTARGRKKYRIKGRFYVIILVCAALMVWGIVALLKTMVPPRVEWGRLETDQEVTAVVLRDEQVVKSTEYAKMECLVPEGQTVTQDQEVVRLYTSGYSDKDVTNLIDLRQKIKDYQEVDILQSFVDQDLQSLNDQIDAKLTEIAGLVSTQQTRGLLVQEQELSTLMQARYDYMLANVTADSQLTKMYEQEAALVTKIDSTKKMLTAPSAGVISYFLDGYESTFCLDTLPAMDIGTLRSVIKTLESGGIATDTGTGSIINIDQPMYRIVNSEHWYVLMIIPRLQNTLIKDGDCDISFEGYEDQLLAATVYDVREQGSNALVILELHEPIGNLVSLRLVEAHIGRSLEGFKIPADALLEQDGQQGVQVVIDGQTTFIAVEVLAQDSQDAIVREVNTDGPRLVLDQEVVVP